MPHWAGPWLMRLERGQAAPKGWRGPGDKGYKDELASSSKSQQPCSGNPRAGTASTRPVRTWIRYRFSAVHESFRRSVPTTTPCDSNRCGTMSAAAPLRSRVGTGREPQRLGESDAEADGSQQRRTPKSRCAWRARPSPRGRAEDQRERGASPCSVGNRITGRVR